MTAYRTKKLTKLQEVKIKKIRQNLLALLFTMQMVF